MRIPLVSRFLNGKSETKKERAKRIAHERRVAADEAKAKAAGEKAEELQEEHDRHKASEQRLTDTAFGRVRERTNEMASGALKPTDERTAAEAAEKEYEKAQAEDGA